MLGKVITVGMLLWAHPLICTESITWCVASQLCRPKTKTESKPSSKGPLRRLPRMDGKLV